MQSAITAMTSGNLIVAIVLGGGVSQLFGMIRLLQILLLSAIAGVVYPAHLTLFYSYCIVFAEMDIFQGIKESKFNVFSIEVTPTASFNPVFEQYNIENMSFFMNSGSMNIIFVLILINFVVMTILIYLSKKFF